MNWKEEFIKLLESGAFKTDSEIDDYADDQYRKEYCREQEQDP